MEGNAHSLINNFFGLITMIHIVDFKFYRTIVIPYSGKFSREKTFAKMTNKKISRRKLSQIHTIDQIWVARACDVREENFREQAQIREIHESFLPRKFPAIRYIRLELAGLYLN